jgi:hypothetical protein
MFVVLLRDCCGVLVFGSSCPYGDVVVIVLMFMLPWCPAVFRGYGMFYVD